MKKNKRLKHEMITEVAADKEHLLQREVNDTLDKFMVCDKVHA